MPLLNLRWPYRGQALARHAKESGPRRFITQSGHRPERHNAVIELSHERLLERAEADRTCDRDPAA